MSFFSGLQRNFLSLKKSKKKEREQLEEVVRNLYVINMEQKSLSSLLTVSVLTSNQL